jgi:hypothetical protein
VLPVMEQQSQTAALPTEAETGPKFDLRSQLTEQPITWRQSLHRAASDLNLDSSLALVDELPGEFEGLGRSLRDLIENYRFDLLMELLDG